MTRSELYLSVWAEPVMHVAKRIGISDRGLAEVCKRVDIPTPPRGYWRRIQTGQTPDRVPLPRPEDDSVVPFTVEGALSVGIKPIKATGDALKPVNESPSFVFQSRAVPKAPVIEPIHTGRTGYQAVLTQEEQSGTQHLCRTCELRADNVVDMIEILEVFFKR